MMKRIKALVKWLLDGRHTRRADDIGRAVLTHYDIVNWHLVHIRGRGN